MSSTPQSIAQCRSEAAPSRRPFTAKVLLKMLTRVSHGELQLHLPDGTRHTFVGKEAGPQVELSIRDWRAVSHMMKAGDIGIAEAWRDGWLNVSDMTAFLTWCIANQSAIASAFYGGKITALIYRVMHLLRPNTKSGARKNIHAHYDLGNEFYGLWLDPTLTYSSAVFAGNRQQSLADAQTAKYERILSELNIGAGDHILEVGCGWGGFAEYAASSRGCKVTGLTISEAQLAYAKARIERAGLTEQVDLKFCDYRDADGTYDAVVSIEMIEAVGERFWPSYFKTLHDRLKPGGRAMIQGIVIDDAAFEMYRSTSDFIREYIFPGGMLASPERWQREAESAGLTWHGSYAFGPDYAETLRRWRDAFNRESLPIARMGFDARFQQIWRFYLHYCEAGFDTGRTDVLHIHLVKPQ
jgi:cyclopropane-fatty-acyl-phospholipid synthase